MKIKKSNNIKAINYNENKIQKIGGNGSVQFKQQFP